MKHLYILGLLFFSVCCHAQTKLQPFVSFVGKNFKVPETLKTDCNWYYAIVSCKVDATGRITKYELINYAPDTLKRSFSFLTGYKFNKIAKVSNRSLLFALTIDNKQENCKIQQDKYYTYSEIMTRIFNEVATHINKHPSTIMIDAVLEFPVQSATP